MHANIARQPPERIGKQVQHSENLQPTSSDYDTDRSLGLRSVDQPSTAGNSTTDPACLTWHSVLRAPVQESKVNPRCLLKTLVLAFIAKEDMQPPKESCHFEFKLSP